MPQNWVSNPPRVAIYSQDGLGLGHMRRTSSIASKLLQMRPDAGVLTLSDSRLGQFFQTHENHDYLKLPSIIKSGPGEWRPASLPLTFQEVSEMRRELIRSALLSFSPDLLLVDHMPHGAMGELLPALEALRKSCFPTRVVLGLRDIIDDPEVVTRRWQDEGAYEALELYYDRVLVYGMRDVYDIADQYRLSSTTAGMLRYCGYVCSLDSARNTEKIRARHLAGTPDNTRLILAMAGGGADSYPLMRTLIDAVPLLQAKGRCVVVMITGPFLPQEKSAELHRLSRRLPVHILQSVEDISSYINAADLVVSMAGYNTTVEILRFKKPAILVPRPGPSSEQRTRTRLFANRGWVTGLDPDALTSGVMAEAIFSTLQHSRSLPVRNRPDLHGLVVAAYHLLTLLLGDGEAERIPVPADMVGRV